MILKSIKSSKFPLIFLILIHIASFPQISNSQQNFLPKHIFSDNSFSFLTSLSETERSQIYSFVEEILTQKLQQKLQNSPILSELKCLECKGAVYLLGRLPAEILVHSLEFIAFEICKIKKLYIPQVCEETIQEMGDIIVHALMDRFLTPDYFCGFKLNICPSKYRYLNRTEYILNVTKDKPKNPRVIPSKKKTYKMLHITDIHIDFDYSENTSSVCNKPLCCRKNSVPLKGKENYTSGYWGTDKSCDLPPRTAEVTFKYINKTFPDIQGIYWTGDNIGHDIWNQSNEEILNGTKVLSNMIKEYLPSVQVIPTLGNHEHFPVNVYDYFDGKSSWLTGNISLYWSDFIKDPMALDLFKQYGYYTIYSKEKNLRYISIHTVACNSQNWELFRNVTDPGKTLHWLRLVLENSEKNNETVHLLGHVPPRTGTCLKPYVDRYLALVDRFSHIIRGHFFGHVHADEYFLLKGYVDNTTATDTVFMPGSLTTYSNNFPTFRIMEFDQESNIMVNYKNYFMNLTKMDILNYTKEEVLSGKGNLSALFDFEYEFQKTYNLSDCSVGNMEKLSDSFEKNIKNVKSYIQYYGQNDPVGFANAKKATLKSNGHSLYCSTWGELRCPAGKSSFVDSIIPNLFGNWTGFNDHN